MKNKIAELIDEATILAGKTTSEGIAVYLTENNVIKLPCRINDTLYLANGDKARVMAFYIDGCGGMFDLEVATPTETVAGYKSYITKDYKFEDIGRTLFFEKPAEGEDE